MFKKAVLSHVMIWTLVLSGVAGLFSAGPVLAQGQSGKPIRVVNDLGVTVADSAEGARIEQVAANSLAEALGLQRNDRITAVNGQPVDAEHNLESRLRASGLVSGLTFSVERDGQTLTLQLTQAEIAAASGGAASLMDHLRSILGSQILAALGNASSGASTRATQPDQPTIGESLSGRLGATRGWMSNMLSSLQDLFASFRTNTKADIHTR